MSSRIRPSVYHIGTAVGLASLAAFYIALILAYSFRIDVGQSWRSFRMPALLWFSTWTLLLSSCLLENARWFLRRARIAAYRKRLVATLAVALLFLAAQLSSGSQLLGQGVAAAANPHGSAFYVFMGLHGTHLLGGIGWLSRLWYRSGQLETENEIRRHRIAAGAAAMYWHFMAVLWLVLFFFLRRWTS